VREIESDLVEQLLEVYRRGTSHDEFWELVERGSSPRRTEEELHRVTCAESEIYTTRTTAIFVGVFIRSSGFYLTIVDVIIK